MLNYSFQGTTHSGIPVRVEAGFDDRRQAYRMAIDCTDPDLIGDTDPCLFSTDRLPADLTRPEPLHLQSVLEGFGIQMPASAREILGTASTRQ